MFCYEKSENDGLDNGVGNRFVKGKSGRIYSLTDVPTSAVIKMLSENSLHEYYMQVDEKDTLYLVDGESPQLYIIPKSGSIEKTVALPEDMTYDYLWNPQGQLQFIGKDENGKGTVYYLDTENVHVEEMTEVSCEDVQALGLDEQGNICYYTGNELFFWRAGQKESFLKYEKVIVKPEDLLCFRATDNSVIYLDDCRKLIKHTKSEEHVGGGAFCTECIEGEYL